MKRAFVFIAAVVFAAQVLSGCMYFTGRTAGHIVDDSTITGTINSKIVGDSELRFLKINVDSTNGNVVLTGFVPNQSSEARLIELARQVQGVKSVKSQLSVEQQ